MVDIASLVGILTRVEVRTNIYDLKVLTLTVFDPLWITHVVWRLSSWSSRVWRHYFKLQFAWRCHILTFAVQEHHMSSVRDNTTQQVSVEMTRNGASMSNHVNYDFMTIPIIRYPCCSDQPTSAWSNLDSSNQPEQSSQLDAQTHQIYTFSRNGRRRNFSARRDWIGLTSCQTLCDFRPDLLGGRSLPRIPRLWASNRQRDQILVMVSLFDDHCKIIWSFDPRKADSEDDPRHWRWGLKRTWAESQWPVIFWFMMISSWIAYLDLTRELTLTKRIGLSVRLQIPWHGILLCS